MRVQKMRTLSSDRWFYVEIHASEATGVLPHDFCRLSKQETSGRVSVDRRKQTGDGKLPYANTIDIPANQLDFKRDLVFLVLVFRCES